MTATLTLNVPTLDIANALVAGLPVTFGPADARYDVVFTGSLDALRAVTYRYVTPIADFDAGRFATAAAADPAIAYDFDHFFRPVTD